MTKSGEEISRVEGPFSAEMEIYSTSVGDVETLETKDWMLFLMRCPQSFLSL